MKKLRNRARTALEATTTKRPLTIGINAHCVASAAKRRLKCIVIMANMSDLQTLIKEAIQLADSNNCALHGHEWSTEGGRPCPKCYDDCSQSVNVCIRCGAQDYGEVGGPGYAECFAICHREHNEET